MTEQKPQAVIMEIRIPGMDGIVTLRVGKVEGVFPFQAYQHGFALCLGSIGPSFFVSLLLRKRRMSI